MLYDEVACQTLRANNRKIDLVKYGSCEKYFYPRELVSKEQRTSFTWHYSMYTSKGARQLT